MYCQGPGSPERPRGPLAMTLSPRRVAPPGPRGGVSLSESPGLGLLGGRPGSKWGWTARPCCVA